MMLLLVSHILNHGVEVSLGEGNHPIAPLPFNGLPLEMPVGLVGYSPFHPAQELAEFYGGFKLKQQMQMFDCAATSVKCTL